jgi:hypothetical protein
MIDRSGAGKGLGRENIIGDLLKNRQKRRGG